MRLYHFVNKTHGLDNLKNRRLKIATFTDLNDPFELLSIELSNAELRNAFNVLKNTLSNERGILCFSNSWHNPVLWGHYADSHKGICLGFDIPDDKVRKIEYSRKRLLVDIAKFLYPNTMPIAEMEKLLFTKYAHWKYENEFRSFATIEEQDAATKLYFAYFSDEIKLKEVIVGACANISRGEISDALGDLYSSVSIVKSRLAFRSFKVVRQLKSQLWK